MMKLSKDMSDNQNEVQHTANLQNQTTKSLQEILN